jgi:hypothetical protein
MKPEQYGGRFVFGVVLEWPQTSLSLLDRRFMAKTRASECETASLVCKGAAFQLESTRIQRDKLLVFSTFHSAQVEACESLATMQRGESLSR